MYLKRISSHSVVVGAPAKVNLFLEVLSRREDGYHDINSLFQAVSLFDRLRIKRLPGQAGVKLSHNGPDIVPTDERNLICRAYNLIRDRYDLQDGLEVDLEKNIPVAAGLAGGSADAAATILACSVLFNLQLEHTEMARLGLEIGSDVPFFFTKGQALVTGRGEQLTETDFPTDYWLVLVTPNLHISTGESYAGLRTGLTKTRDPFNLQGCRTSEELAGSLKLAGNDFEEVHLASYPVLGRIKDELIGSGALLARMSGSGPTVFGLNVDAPDFEDGPLDGNDDWTVSTVRPVTLPGTLH